jgi:hypothetical protein
VFCGNLSVYYSDSPVLLRLGFYAVNILQIAFITNRRFDFFFPINIFCSITHLSLLHFHSPNLFFILHSSFFILHSSNFVFPFHLTHLFPKPNKL